uniref:biotin transporter BioY n=1 Tax=Abyssisolibacter fermentans TaxID=1766203 RepID=UPI00082D7215
IVYVCMGLAGLPVFSGGKGGFNYIVEPTFGYLIGFIICAYVIGRLTENMGKVSVFRLLISVMAGLAIVYVLGAAYLYLMLNVYLGKAFTIKSAIISGIVPFVLWDAIKGVVAVVTSVSVIPRLRKLGYMDNKKFAGN